MSANSRLGAYSNKYGTFRSLEKHSKGRCKICICSVILGELESFRSFKGLRIIFSKSLGNLIDATTGFDVIMTTEYC